LGLFLFFAVWLISNGFDLSLQADCRDAVFIPTMIFGVVLWVTVVHSLSFAGDSKNLSDEEFESIWGKLPWSRKDNKTRGTKVYLSFEEMISGMSFSKAFGKLFHVFCLFFWQLMFIMLPAAMAWIVLATIVFILVSVPMFIFWLFKEIGKYNHLLTVSAAIVIGGLIGTLLPSVIWGFGSGIIFLTVTYLLNRLFKKIDVFFIFREKWLFGRINAILA
jgi:hypothetical protein